MESKGFSWCFSPPPPANLTATAKCRELDFTSLRNGRAVPEVSLPFLAQLEIDLAVGDCN